MGWDMGLRGRRGGSLVVTGSGHGDLVWCVENRQTAGGLVIYVPFYLSSSLYKK